jgi:adenylosuccinate synthase
MGDLLQPQLFEEKLKRRLKDTNWLLKELGAKPVRLQTIVQEYLKIGERVRPFVTNTVLVIHHAMAAGKEILFEGAHS